MKALAHIIETIIYELVVIWRKITGGSSSPLPKRPGHKRAASVNKNNGKGAGTQEEGLRQAE